MSEKNIYLVTNKYSTDSSYIAKIFVNQNSIIPVADRSVLGHTNNQFSLS